MVKICKINFLQTFRKEEYVVSKNAEKTQYFNTILCQNTLLKKLCAEFVKITNIGT